MAKTKELSDWFDAGVAEGHDYMVVVCDTFDHEDYPVYTSKENVHEKHDRCQAADMQRVMEVYDLKQPKEVQMIPMETEKLFRYKWQSLGI